MTITTGGCRYCGQKVFWHVSKNGKKYPCDSEDRRDFHNCDEKGEMNGADEAYSAPRVKAPAPVQAGEMAEIVQELRNLNDLLREILLYVRHPEPEPELEVK